MTCYFVVNNDLGVVVNAIQYDGESLYEEEGCTLIAQSDVPDGVWIGWRFVDGVWSDNEQSSPDPAWAVASSPPVE